MLEQKTEQRLLVKDCIENIQDINELSRLFFRELFLRDISLERVFPGGVEVLNRKFSNMLNILKNVKHLEKIQPSLARMGERHLIDYGVQPEYFDTAQAALLSALDSNPEIEMDTALREAWQAVFADVAALMKQAIAQVERRKVHRDIRNLADNTDLLEKIGGKDKVTQVHQRFYDVMFDHDWLGQFFFGKSKESLVMKQTQFMVAAFGGENQYRGDTPAFIHMHMFITDEIADLRQNILCQAILDEGLSPEIAERWLQVDDNFRSSIVKKSVNECVLKCSGQMPVVVKKPKNA
ncbi:globin domain-containing protein [Candidatus Venteria ishoeyi]|uniref:Bacterial-like globin n=1 Tax=Candidatus Venteria ishoeyi TaxID=1899563 RepID=A0A1H6FB87_9GAMM|nr:globin domain-containing protein [Candidatus Venteria ishoeyi]MDM8546954.1 hypothetical protein [Candidatus Venteria ishoeyi]SEH07348.1 Bacterial-like globin [Candidatus Venteria ishoeyi]